MAAVCHLEFVGGSRWTTTDECTRVVITTIINFVMIVLVVFNEDLGFYHSGLKLQLDAPQFQFWGIGENLQEIAHDPHDYCPTFWWTQLLYCSGKFPKILRRKNANGPKIRQNGSSDNFAAKYLHDKTRT